MPFELKYSEGNNAMENKGNKVSVVHTNFYDLLLGNRKISKYIENSKYIFETKNVLSSVLEGGCKADKKQYILVA